MKTYTYDQLVADYIKEIEYHTDQGDKETADCICELLWDIMAEHNKNN